MALDSYSANFRNECHSADAAEIEPTIFGLAACLESLELEATRLGQELTANLIGSARLALIDPWA
jgi:hypothetical protein